MRKAIAIGLVLLITATSLSAQVAQMTQQKEIDEYVKGLAEGEYAAKGDGLWLLAGFGLGIFGVIGACITNPTPPAYNLLGKRKEYIMGYTEGYRRKGRAQNISLACGGFAMWVVVVVAVVMNK